MVINTNQLLKAVEELTKREAATGKTSANHGQDFREIMRQAANAASSGKQGITGALSENAWGTSIRDLKAIIEETRLREEELYFRSLEKMQAKKSASNDAEIRKKVLAIWLKFLLTGIITPAELQFLAQHDPGLYRRVLEMMQEKSENELCGDVKTDKVSEEKTEELFNETTEEVSKDEEKLEDNVTVENNAEVVPAGEAATAAAAAVSEGFGAAAS